MDHDMGGPRFAPEDANGHSKGNGDVFAAGPRGLEDSPSGLARDGGDTAGGRVESRAPERGAEARSKAAEKAAKRDDPKQDIRDRMARFDVGIPGGPGNPFGRHIAHNRQLMHAYFTTDKVLALFGKLESMAMEGKVGAHRTLLQYLVGKPLPAVNPDRVNHEEWEMRRELPHPEEVEMQTQASVPHVAALIMQREVDVAKIQRLERQFSDGIAKREAEEAKQAARAERRARRKEERRRRRAGG
jgi:hypothetical protein